MISNEQAASIATETTNPNAIALCLSGGGFRATLFHLGLIRALRTTTFNGDMALHAVREVYAVSGGSILAAHFLMNYTRYVDRDDKVFDKVADELLAFAASDLRNRLLRRWPLWAMARTKNPRGELLNLEYERLLRGRSATPRGPTIGQCYAVPGDILTFHFLSTSFTTGALCSFSRDCFELMPPGAAKPEMTPADSIPLSFAVAASSAFPPMFPPVRLTPKMLGTEGQPPFEADIALSDGGVFDNYGIDKFCLAQRTGARPGLLIVSNAGGSLATDPTLRFDNIVSRNTRASEIMMRRVGETTISVGKGIVGQGLIDVKIGTTVYVSVVRTFGTDGCVN